MEGNSVRQYLEEMVERGASDLHLKADNRPGFRIDGQICVDEDQPVIDSATVLAYARQLMQPSQVERYDRDLDLDFSYAIEGLARFRINVLTQRGSAGLVIRQIPSEIPTVEQLGLPDICTELSAKPRGLVLVTGPTGSGKSTTLAAMIDWINTQKHGHILTMEDPVEFVHEDKNCFVTQRQIGQDCHDFAEALRRALRQDPDVILIGEMRDLETIALAISAAETGHLVFGTLHTTSAISTVDRILDVFPPDQQQQVRVQLSSSLQGVISQCLLPRIGGGRVAAHEILTATNAVRSLIREGKTPQILNVLQTGAKSGMRSLENVLAGYVQEGIIELDDAIAKANRPDEVVKLAGNVRRRTTAADQPLDSSRMQAVPQDRRHDDKAKNLGRRRTDRVDDSRDSQKKAEKASDKPSGVTDAQREASPALRAFRPRRA